MALSHTVGLCLLVCVCVIWLLTAVDFSEGVNMISVSVTVLVELVCSHELFNSFRSYSRVVTGPNPSPRGQSPLDYTPLFYKWFLRGLHPRGLSWGFSPTADK